MYCINTPIQLDMVWLESGGFEAMFITFKPENDDSIKKFPMIDQTDPVIRPWDQSVSRCVRVYLDSEKLKTLRDFAEDDPSGIDSWYPGWADERTRTLLLDCAPDICAQLEMTPSNEMPSEHVGVFQRRVYEDGRVLTEFVIHKAPITFELI